MEETETETAGIGSTRIGGILTAEARIRFISLVLSTTDRAYACQMPQSDIFEREKEGPRL